MEKHDARASHPDSWKFEFAAMIDEGPLPFTGARSVLPRHTTASVVVARSAIDLGLVQVLTDELETALSGGSDPKERRRLLMEALARTYYSGAIREATLLEETADWYIRKRQDEDEFPHRWEYLTQANVYRESLRLLRDVCRQDRLAMARTLKREEHIRKLIISIGDEYDRVIAERTKPSRRNHRSKTQEED